MRRRRDSVANRRQCASGHAARGSVERLATVDKVNEALRENDQTALRVRNLMPIGNSRGIPVPGGLPGWRTAGKPALMVELHAAVRRHSRNRSGHLELAALVAGKCMGIKCMGMRAASVLSGRSR